jgi:hypothetical protein
MRCTVHKIKEEDAILTSEASMTPIKGANITNKVGVAHVMDESMLQTTVADVVDNAVATKKWSSLEATSVTISVLT